MLLFLAIAVFMSIAESQLLNETFIPFVTGPWIQLPFENKCFDGIGCFYNGPPWFSIPDRPVSYSPNDDITPDFLLFTPANVDVPDIMNLTVDTISRSNIDPDYPTKIIIHGYNVNVQANDTRYRIKQALLEKGFYNIIIVDWAKNNRPPYPQAVANGRVVGAQIAKLITILELVKNVKPDDVHIIGHSLGAHVAGFAGKKLFDRVGRITGLDPAGPYFTNAIPPLRLDRSDAKFVDIIHTNSANNFIQGFGLEQAIGDIDFYPNGGTHQPGCQTNNEIEEKILAAFPYLLALSCDHSRAYEYFISSITYCNYVAVQCSNYLSYLSEACNDQTSTTTVMGYHAQKMIGLKGRPKFYLQTEKSPPFCNKAENLNVINDADTFPQFNS